MQEYCSREELSVYATRHWKSWLGGRAAVRVLLFLWFLIPLAIFFHFREKPLENLDVGVKAPRYVIAQIDFDFPDEEATQVMRQEATKDIGAIYALQVNQIEQERSLIEKKLIEVPTWREELLETSFEEMALLLDAMGEKLCAARFTSERTLQRIKKFHLSHKDLYGIKVSSRHLADVELPPSFWEEGQEHLSTLGQKDAARYVVALFSCGKWSLAQDYVYEHSIEQSVQNHIAHKYSHVEAGTPIIKRGETVTARHVTMLSHMSLALAKTRNLWAPVALVGSTLLALCIGLLALFYLRTFHPELLRDLNKLGLLITIFVFTAFLAKGGEHLLLYGSRHFVEMAHFALFVPIASILITVLIDSRLAFVTSLLLILIFSITLAVDPPAFLFSNVVACSATILFARCLHRRREVFSVFGKVWLVCIPLLISFNLSKSIFWNSNVLITLLGCLAFLWATALLVIALLPLLEFLSRDYRHDVNGVYGSQS